MSKVIWHVTMSLDGFIAGPGHAMEWAFEYEWDSALSDEVKGTTGAILAGRNWYDAATERYSGRQGIYGGDWDGPVFVITHDPPADPADPEITFLSSGTRDAVATASKAAGEKNLEIFGANTARQCLEERLIDEIAVHVAPVMLGDGVRLHEAPGGGRVDLERIELAEAGALTDLRFRVKR